MYKKLNRELTAVLENGVPEEAEEKINELLKELKDWLDYYNWISRCSNQANPLILSAVR